MRKIVETVARAVVHSLVIHGMPMLAYRALESSGDGSIFLYGTIVRGLLTRRVAYSLTHSLTHSLALTHARTDFEHSISYAGLSFGG